MRDAAITISLSSLRRIFLRAFVAAVVLVALAVLWQQRDALGGIFARGVPQVLLIENLRDDSAVVQAIKRNKAGEPLGMLAPPLATPRPTGTR